MTPRAYTPLSPTIFEDTVALKIIGGDQAGDLFFLIKVHAALRSLRHFFWIFGVYI